MAYGVSYRVAPGTRVYRTTSGGFFAFATAISTIGLSFQLFFLAIQLAVIVTLIVGSIVAFVVFLVTGHFETKRRLAQLHARAVEPNSVTVAGPFTTPRTWGVYRVEGFTAGRRTTQFRLGNHPIRQQELVHEFGHAELVELFAMRADAEEFKYLLVSGHISLVSSA